MIYYPYEEFKQDTLKLIDKLKASRYDAIIAISRGGFTLAHAVSQALGIKDVRSIRSSLYDGKNRLECVEIFGSCELEDQIQNALVVDDISDSGETLEAVMAHLISSYPHTTFESCTIFYKNTSKYRPTYFVHKSSEWIEFYWEVDFKVGSV